MGISFDESRQYIEKTLNYIYNIMTIYGILKIQFYIIFFQITLTLLFIINFFTWETVWNPFYHDQ